jgi:hypothetical protein
MERVMAWDSHRLRPAGGAPPYRRAALARVVEHFEGLAVELSARPLTVCAGVVGLNLGLAACFVGAGSLAGDEALLFRELAPATLLSFAELLLIAAAAHAAHRVAAPGRRVWGSFWGLAAAIFLVFAFDEITQSLIFLSAVLEDAFALAPRGGFHDLEAVLLSLLFAGSALVLLPRSRALLRHPVAVTLILLGGLLGVASQSLDSFAPATRSEFVAEETLKLGAEALLLGGFLVALDRLRSGEPS